MGRKLTNEIIDERIGGRPIKRLGDYIDIHTKIPFQCLSESCNLIWSTEPNVIVNAMKGCPKCAIKNNADKLRFSNEIVDQKLFGRNIKRLDDHINFAKKTRFECLIEICCHIWITSTNSVINDGDGCPKCAGLLSLTNEIIDNRLQGRQIKRVGNCINSKTPIEFNCLVKECNYNWMTTPGSITSKNPVDCPKCAGQLRLTNELIDQKLINRKIKRVGNCITGKIKIPFQCLESKCNYIWETSPGNILNAKTGCPKCSIKKMKK